MAAKKLTRKQLLKEPDEFLTSSSRLFMFIMERKWYFLGLVGLLVLLATLGSGIHFISQRSQNKAFLMLSDIQSAYNKSLAATNAKQAYADTQPMFEKLLDQFGGRQAGKMGRLAYGNAAFSGGEYQKASELFAQGVKDWPKDSTNYNLALYGLGHAHKSAENLDAALDAFSKLADGISDTFKPEAYFYQAQIFKQKSDLEAYQNALEKIVNEYPDFIFVDIVKAQLAQAS